MHFAQLTHQGLSMDTEVLRQESFVAIPKLMKRNLKTRLETEQFKDGAAAPCDVLLRCFVDLLIESDHRRATEIVLGAGASGITLPDIYIRILQPAMQEIGRRYENGQATGVDQQFAATVTRRIMTRLHADAPRGPHRSRSIVTACVEGDKHDAGIAMLSDLMDLDGWDAYCAGPDVPTRDLLITIERRKPDVVALSAAMLDGLLPVADVVAALRSSEALAGTRIMVGGQLFNEDSHLWRKVGADGYARDATDAVLLANWLMNEERRCA
jgi:MerR family transcriptional regulator, light-induced transcriptional regulator